MTCIVGINEGGRIWIGADSLGVAGTFAVVRKDRKLIRLTSPGCETLIGFSGSYRLGHLLAHGFEPPRPRAGDDPAAFMVTDFVEAVRNRLRAGGALRVKDQVEEIDGAFLVGFGGRLFQIEQDLQAGEAAAGYDACGSGAEVALGALHATRGRADPEARLTAALEAAEAHGAAVRRPFHIESMP